MKDKLRMRIEVPKNIRMFGVRFICLKVKKAACASIEYFVMRNWTISNLNPL